MCTSIITLHETIDEKIVVQDSTKLLGDLYFLNARSFISCVIKLSIRLCHSNVATGEYNVATGEYISIYFSKYPFHIFKNK